MQIQSNSEWMSDEKQAVVMAPGRDFQVIQTSSGSAIFFSIGTDNVLYATREVQSSSTGWTRISLSAPVAPDFPGASISAKCFCVAQNPQTLLFDIALIVTVASTDYLYLSLGNTATDAAWTPGDPSIGLQWKPIPVDGKDLDANSIDMSAVYLVALPSDQSTTAQTCMVDVVRTKPLPNTMRLVDRYYIMPAQRIRWNKHNLAIDLAAGSIICCPGRRAKDRVAGLYTFGTIASTLQLIFTPAYDFFDPTNPPSPARLRLPADTTGVTSAFNDLGYSNLFVSGSDGLYLFPPDSQKDGSSGSAIITHPLVASSSRLSADTSGDITVLYGVSADGALFYTTCAAGSEARPEAWSCPVPLVDQIQRYAFFVNRSASNNTLFALVADQEVTQITQDPITRDWAPRAILLPSTNIDDVISFNSFTTRLYLTGADAADTGAAEVLLKSASPVGVFINNAYRVLNPSTAIKAKTNSNGVITIVQPTQDSVAICYSVVLASSTIGPVFVDPAAKAKAKLATLQSKADLDSARIQLSNGDTRPLVGSDVSDDDRDAAVATIKQLLQVGSSLPRDGMTQNTSTATDGGPTSQLLNISTCQGPTARISIVDAAIGSGANILVKAGDLFRSILHSAWSAVKNFVIRAVNGIYEVLIKVGETIYRAVLDTAAAIARGVEWVFTQIKVGIEDIKNWLGFVFNWKDIVRTHKAIKTVITTYAVHSISQIIDVQNFVNTGFDTLEQKLNAWADVPDTNVTVGQTSDDTTKHMPGYNDPQTNYMHEKVQANIGNADTVAKASDVERSGWSGVLADLKDLATKEGKAVTDSIQRIKDEIIDQISSLTPMEVVKRLIAIVGTLVLETAKNLVVTTLGIVKDLSLAVLEELSKPIKIPIISKLYKTIADEGLSIVDLVCLVAAVPATIIYKAITGSTPFPDNASTSRLISASNFDAVQNIFRVDNSIYKTFTVVSEFAAMAGLTFSVILNEINLPNMTASKPGKVPDKIKQVSIPVKLLAIMPNLVRPTSDTDGWEEKFNHTITSIAFMKVCLDATKIGERDEYGEVSPYIDYAISALWIVPSIGRIVTNHSRSSDYMSLSTSLVYDVAVMASPLLWTDSIDADEKAIIFAAANVMIVICGVVRVATGGLLHDGD